MALTGKYRGTIEYALVYNELINAARYRGTVTYQEIAKLMGIPLTGGYMAKLLGEILGEISEDEVAHGRPMLSAIAVGVKGSPSEGFYNWARGFGRLTNQANDHFWAEEKKAVYDTWKIRLKENN
ncbi:MAG: hypothetical protein ACYDH2_14845 [Anaerolineaceae bacterium]